MSYPLIREILEEPWNPNGPSAPTGANPNANGRRVSQLRPMLRSTELIVAICIAIHADNDTRMGWPGIERLARMTRRSRRAVYRAISSLRRMGVLEIVKGGAARFGSPGDLYKFNDPVLPPMGDFATTGKSATSGKSASSGKSATSGKSASSGTSCATSGTESVPPVALKLPEGTTMNSGGAGEEALLSRCRAIFRIRPTSKLDTAQEKAWRKAAPLVVDTLPDEWEQLQAYYAADISSRDDYRRRDLSTLLNNWSGEVTRARDWCTKVGWRPTTPAATVPEDWRRLLDIVIERDYGQQLAAEDPAAYEKWKAFNDQCYSMWTGVPDWLQRQIGELAAQELEATEPEAWRAVLTVMVEAGEIDQADANFESWNDVPLSRRIEVRNILETAETGPTNADG
jgi:hypothetical protein